MGFAVAKGLGRRKLIERNVFGLGQHQGRDDADRQKSRHHESDCPASDRRDQGARHEGWYCATDDAGEVERQARAGVAVASGENLRDE
jgi:hypothetical protein